MSLAIAFGAHAAADERLGREVLAEMVNDRLRVVREGLGATYGIHARVVSGSLRVVGDVEPAYADQAAKAVAGAIAALRDGGPGLAEDFARARTRVLMRSLARPVGAENRASALERLVLDGAPAADLDREPDKIRALDLATVRRIAARDLSPDRMIAVARGKRDGIHAALLALGATPSTIETFTRTAPAKPAAPQTEHMQTASAGSDHEPAPRGP